MSTEKKIQQQEEEPPFKVTIPDSMMDELRYMIERIGKPVTDETVSTLIAKAIEFYLDLSLLGRYEMQQELR
jgi:hypothetical protein